MKGAKGLRTAGQKSILESMGGTSKEVERPAKRVKVEQDEQKPTSVVNPWTPFRKENGKIRETSWTSHESSPSHLLSPIDAISPAPDLSPTTGEQLDEAEQKEKSCPQIFANLAFYINGSTAPAISDHKFKQIISSHGGRMPIALGRRTVTHVIIGRPNSNGGCGGGLSGSKIQKEISRIGGNALHFITAEWVTDSVKAGKRLPESRFEAMKLAPKGVNSVASMFGASKKTSSGAAKSDEVG